MSSQFEQAAANVRGASFVARSGRTITVAEVQAATARGDGAVWAVRGDDGRWYVIEEGANGWTETAPD